MLIALSGVQGSGKTTVLNGLKNLGFGVIERKTARSILADWSLTLEQVYADQAICQRFHDELLVRKAKDETDAMASDDLWFTERSYADLFTYALVSLGHFNKYSEWLDMYYNLCKDENKKYLAVCFLNAPTNRSIEHDGVRGTNQHYVQQIDTNVRSVCKSMSVTNDDTVFRHITHNPLVDITQELVDQRVRFVASYGRELWLTRRLHVDADMNLLWTHPVRVEETKRLKEMMAEAHAVSDSRMFNNNI